MEDGILAVQFDVRTTETAALLDRLKGKAPNAVRGAMKDVGKMVRTQMAREVSKKIAVKYGSVLSRIRIFGPTTDLTMRVIIDEKQRPGLTSFGARKAKKGITYKIAKDGKREYIEGAFIGRGNTTGIRGGHLAGWIAGTFTGPALGQERAFKRMGSARLPVIDLKGPSLNAVVTKNDIDTAQKQVIESKLPERILARLRLADQRSR